MAYLQTQTTLPQTRPSTNPYQDLTQNILGNTRNDENGLFGNLGLSAKSEVETRPMLRRLSAGLYPRIASQIGFGNSLQDDKQNAILSALALLSPGTQRANADAIARQARGGAAESAQMAAMLARSNGLGSGAQQGAIHDAFAQGNQAGNNYMTQFMSPEGQAQLMALVMQAIKEGQDTSGLQDLMNINQILQSKPKEQSGGIGGILGGLAGSWLGGPGGAAAFNKIF